MIRLRPITSRIASRLLRRTFVDSAERSIEVAPGISYPVEPPIMLPDEAARITRYHFDCAPGLNYQRLTGRVMSQGPTRIHLLRNVVIADGTLLARNCYDRLAPAPKRLLVRGELEHVDEAALCSTFLTHRFFGHWLREGTALEELAAELGLSPLVVERPPWLHEPGYRDMLALRCPPRISAAWCDRLWVSEDRRFNSHFAQRYHRIRRRLRALVRAPLKATGRVFISRGNQANGRGLANEKDVRETLSAHGFTLLDPERTDARSIATVLSRARLVVSPEGSAMAHAAIAIPRGAGLITIVGAQHFNIPYKEISDALGFHYGLTIADAVDADQYAQPIDRLLRTIDLVYTAVELGGSCGFL